MSTRSIVAACLLLGGCQVGPRLESYAPAQQVAGVQATMTIELPGQSAARSGELVAVRAEDFLVLTSDGLTRIPNDLVREGRFEDARPGRISGAGSDRQRRDLARFSRYPLGLSEAQLRNLLDAIGQPDLIEAGR